MAENLSLGQIVPKSPGLTEGLFLMDGIEGLRSLPRHSVDMLLGLFFIGIIRIADFTSI